VYRRGRDWIRVPALVWSGLMTANVLIILMEERYGTWATLLQALLLQGGSSG
jgi:hypothetical protein